VIVPVKLAAGIEVKLEAFPESGVPSAGVTSVGLLIVTPESLVVSTSVPSSDSSISLLPVPAAGFILKSAITYSGLGMN
jgi:hypothetical protein